jgi:hypothetical protein
MLLIQYGDAPTPFSPDRWGRLSEDEQRAIFAGYQEVNQTPGVAPGIRPAATATTVRVENGKTLTTKGPSVALEDAVGGYLFFEADDLGSAVELAARIPAARMGGAVEIRPVLQS